MYFVPIICIFISLITAVHGQSGLRNAHDREPSVFKAETRRLSGSGTEEGASQAVSEKQSKPPEHPASITSNTEIDDAGDRNEAPVLIPEFIEPPAPLPEQASSNTLMLEPQGETDGIDTAGGSEIVTDDKNTPTPSENVGEPSHTGDSLGAPGPQSQGDGMILGGVEPDDIPTIDLTTLDIMAPDSGGVTSGMTADKPQPIVQEVGVLTDEQTIAPAPGVNPSGNTAFPTTDGNSQQSGTEDSATGKPSLLEGGGNGQPAPGVNPSGSSASPGNSRGQQVPSSGGSSGNKDQAGKPSVPEGGRQNGQPVAAGVNPANNRAPQKPAGGSGDSETGSGVGNSPGGVGAGLGDSNAGGANPPGDSSGNTVGASLPGNTSKSTNGGTMAEENDSLSTSIKQDGSGEQDNDSGGIVPPEQLPQGPRPTQSSKTPTNNGGMQPPGQSLDSPSPEPTRDGRALSEAGASESLSNMATTENPIAFGSDVSTSTPTKPSRTFSTQVSSTATSPSIVSTSASKSAANGEFRKVNRKNHFLGFLLVFIAAF